MLSLFFAEFDNVTGPTVVYEMPEGLIQSPGMASTATPSSRRGGSDIRLDFDAISEFIIPKPVLCNRLVTICTARHKVVGYPVSIEDPNKYERNALLFNLCFVFELNADTSSFEQVVRKMARLLRSLEMESEFISNKNTKSNVMHIMEQILQDLTTYSECEIPINDANTINLKILPNYPNPDLVKDWQVPVALVDIAGSMEKNWDMTLRRIAPLINGVNSVKRIADMADVENELVRIAIQHLLYYGCVKMVDVFQFSNVYSIISLEGLVSNPALQAECIAFITYDSNLPPISFGQVLHLYSTIKNGWSVQGWIEQHNLSGMNVDFRKVVIFGVLKGLLYRVHKYPLWVPAVRGEFIGQESELVAKYQRFLDGTCCYDQICTELQVSVADLDSVLSSFGQVYMFWR